MATGMLRDLPGETMQEWWIAWLIAAQFHTSQHGAVMQEHEGGGLQ